MGVYTEDLCERLSDDLAGRFFLLAGRVVPSGSARAARASGAVIFEFAPLTPLPRRYNIALSGIMFGRAE